MRILVVGASGRTGRIFTRLALERGNEVTAFVREPGRFGVVAAGVRVIEGDVLSPETLPPAFIGQDAVVSLLAPRPRRDGSVYTEGTRSLADAAEASGVPRLVVVSAEGAGVSRRALPLGYRLVTYIPVVSRLYPDIAQMERELASRTALDWTIVRAAILTNGRHTGQYRTTVGDVVAHGLRISRADLAEFLLAVVEGREYIHQTVAVAY